MSVNANAMYYFVSWFAVVLKHLNVAPKIGNGMKRTFKKILFHYLSQMCTDC
jgi:hypothetical protein